jgi:hypothetical protein
MVEEVGLRVVDEFNVVGTEALVFSAVVEIEVFVVVVEVVMFVNGVNVFETKVEVADVVENELVFFSIVVEIASSFNTLLKISTGFSINNNGINSM